MHDDWDGFMQCQQASPVGVASLPRDLEGVERLPAGTPLYCRTCDVQFDSDPGHPDCPACMDRALRWGRDLTAAWLASGLEAMARPFGGAA